MKKIAITMITHSAFFGSEKKVHLSEIKISCQKQAKICSKLSERKSKAVTLANNKKQRLKNNATWINDLG